jgi:2-keto-3-deoxy-L-rhamnonate aldolase RhmA
MRYNNLEKFLKSIEEGKLCTGCCITFGDPTVTEIAAEAGFDFCWIDGEHGVLDRTTAMLHIMALKGTGCAPFYRVPACDHTEIKKVIDLAPAGIIVPMILNEDDARYAVEACRYPLSGNRGCGVRRGHCYGTMNIDEYWKLSQSDPMVILQIEHIEAVRNLDKILAVPGINSILIGPYDLSFSMGHPGEWQNPQVANAIDEICRKTRQAGILLGAYAEADLSRWITTRQIQYLSCINDTGALMTGFRQQLAEVKKYAK